MSRALARATSTAIGSMSPSQTLRRNALAAAIASTPAPQPTSSTLSRAATLQQTVEMQQAAPRRPVMAGAEGEARLDLDRRYRSRRRASDRARHARETAPPAPAPGRRANWRPSRAFRSARTRRRAAASPAAAATSSRIAPGRAQTRNRPRPARPCRRRATASVSNAVEAASAGSKLSTIRSATARARARRVRRITCAALFGGRPSSMAAHINQTRSGRRASSAA